MRAQGAGKPASIGLVRSGLGSTHDIGDKLLVAGAILVRHHHRLAHPGVLAKPGGDLARLDAEAADLHLLIVAAQELQIAVRQVAGKIAGLVHPGAGLVAERIGQKPLRRQLGTVEVTARHPGPADIELTHRSERHRPTMAVQKIHPRVGDRAPDRHVLMGYTGPSVNKKTGRPDRCFGRTVEIP
ncbi:hypothetical protein M728_005317 (plasmid) [Ensifer sp. WSM1721]